MWKAKGMLTKLQQYGDHITKAFIFFIWSRKGEYHGSQEAKKYMPKYSQNTGQNTAKYISFWNAEYSAVIPLNMVGNWIFYSFDLAWHEMTKMA